MNFTEFELDHQTRDFWREVRDFCDTEVTPELREQIWIEDSYHDHDLYRKLGERGWIMGQWPRERGGAGLTQLQDKILHAEIDRAEAPVFCWGLTRLILPAVQQFGSPE